jgi:hypothetical protein
MDDHDGVMDGNSDGDNNNGGKEGDEWVSIEYNHITSHHITMTQSSSTVQQWIDIWIMKILLSLSFSLSVSLTLSHTHTLSVCG